MPQSPGVETLAFNVGFQCQHCTDCCRGWAVRLSENDYRKMSATLQKAGRSLDDYFTPLQNDPHATAELKKVASGACVFLDEVTNLCCFQSEFGVDTLPSVCRTFPRLRVNVGTTKTYALSSACPTARGLLTAENECRVVPHTGFDASLYDGLRSLENERPLTLGNRSLPYADYQQLIRSSIEGLNDTTRSVEENLHAIVASWSRMEDPQAVATLPPSQAIALVSAWLGLYTRFSPQPSPLLKRLIEKYTKAPLDLQKVQKTYETTAKPFLEKHHWIVRNFLAQRLFYAPRAVEQDLWLLPLSMALIAYGLLRLALVETTDASQEELLNLIGEIDKALLHSSTLEDAWINALRQAKLTAQAFFAFIPF